MLKIKRKQIAVEPIYDSDYFNPLSKLIKIPDTSKERCDQGIIKYIGTDCDPMYEVGKVVIFSGYTGTTLGIDNEIVILIHQDFIKAQIDIEGMVVPGLFISYKVAEGFGKTGQPYYEYHPATYETVQNLISKAYQEQIGGRVDIKKEEYKSQRDEIDERSR